MSIINFKNKRYNSFLHKERNYWLLNVISADDLSYQIQSLSNDLFTQFRYEDLYLIISNEFESFDDLPYQIYKNLVLTNYVPEHKIIFISGAKNISDICNSTTLKINSLYNTNYRGLTNHFFCPGEIDVLNILKKTKTNCHFKRELALQGKTNYQKHFLCLNRRWRLHRPSLISLLHSKNLLSYGYVSLGSNVENNTWMNVLPKIVDKHKDHFISYNLILQNTNKILSLPNLEVDTDDYENKGVVLTRRNGKYYENSFMSVVTETNFYDYNNLFLSEKIFKPIAYLQPFILVSVYKSLGMLQDMGYKTFHPFIDESYDNEKNDCERLMLIVNEIERICKMNNAALQTLSIQLKDVCKHNYNLLTSRYINNMQGVS